MKRVVIESPLSGDRELHKLYARVCVLDCLVKGEAPYASHLFFDHVDVLNDNVEAERELGIAAGFAWGSAAVLRVFYLDLGESGGMKLGREQAVLLVQPTADRQLYGAQFDDKFIDLPRGDKVQLLRFTRDLLRKQWRQ